MIFTVEILAITVSVVVVLGGLVYVLHRSGKRDIGQDNDPESGEPRI